MFSSKRTSLNQLIAVLTLILTLTMVFSLAIVGSVSAATGLNVYVISTNDSTNDAAVLAALSSAGYNPTLGVTIDSFDGSQSFSGFDVVVLIYHEWTKYLPPGGQTALVNFVNNGGGLVTGEWTIWTACVGDIMFLESILPATSDTGCTYYNTPPETTIYEQATADVILNNGVDSPFNITLGNVAGTEQVLLPKDGATVFYSSSQTGYAGLVGWDYGMGHVTSFSTLISNVELGNPNYNRLFTNTVQWAAGGKYVEIDVKPGSDPNSINLINRGVVTVAVITTDDFDAATVDPGTVKFAGALPLRWSLEDADFDGDMDVLFHFKTLELDLNEYSSEARLKGMTFDGLSILGKDAVRIVP